MKVTVLRHSNMGMVGSSLLRGIQNKTLPNIDLFVREGLQNSMDAAIPGKKKVTVDIRTGSCECRKVNKLLEGITKVLDNRFSEETVDFIAIRDSGTTGLTGPLRHAEATDEKNFGNLRKLIYEFGQNQEGEQKGGSWGIGKSVYFRMGIGIVFFYSRAKMENGTYRSVLAAALIENEKEKEQSLIAEAGIKNGKVNTGIAWWGDKDIDGEALPVTDENEIRKVLSILQLAEYTGEETGTCIFIPYINKEKLAENANPYDDKFTAPFNEYISLAVQRWYFPRLYNDGYPYGAYLNLRMNGTPIRSTSRRMFFCKMQELYNEAVRKVEDPNYEPEGDVKIEAINIRSTLDGTTAGYLAYRKFSKEDLAMTVPNNEPAPYHLILKDYEPADGNLPVVAYCREAGMVISYETDSAWTKGVSRRKEDEFLLGFFHPVGKNHLKDYPQLCLDEYLRKTERADHAEWSDIPVGDNNKRQNIVERICKGVANQLRKENENQAFVQHLQADASLKSALGRMFLPPEGFGGFASPRIDKVPPGDGENTGEGGGGVPGEGGNPNPPAGGPGGNKIFKHRGVRLKLGAASFLPGNIMSVPFKLEMKPATNVARLSFKIHTSGTDMKVTEWEKDVGNSLPVVLDENAEKVEFVQGICRVEMLKSEKGNCYGVSFYRETGKENIKIKGELKLKFRESSISVAFMAEDLS